MQIHTACRAVTGNEGLLHYSFSIVEMVNNVINMVWKNFSCNATPLAATEVSTLGTLSKLGLTWMQTLAPAFYINSKQVKMLYEPEAFYKLLLEETEKAQKRIILASLYLGNGPLEENLMFALRNRLRENPNLKVKILLDCTRGSRGKINSRKMIVPLLKEFKKSCQVNLFQTPFLQGPLVPYLPEKYKEVIGLQHMKLYVFDDNLIITGANLSNDYFTNRQDRYMLISDCSELTNFIEGLVDRVSDFSFYLNGMNELSLNKSWPYNPNKTDPKVFNCAAAIHIKNYYEGFLKKPDRGESDTVIFPLLEMGPLGIHVDSKVTAKIFEKSSNETFIYLTTGYFNLTHSYINTLINKSKAQFRILMAHPTANGFYKAKGPAGGIPSGYTHIAFEFLDKVIENQQCSRIKMLEYKRDGWTYHAKGLWLSFSKFQSPFLTMIGSPNFGERSVKRDLECQFLLATTNECLQNELQSERNLLSRCCHPFTEAVRADPKRKTPFWVEVVVWLFRSYL